MKKALNKLTAVVIVGVTSLLTALPAFAETPADNGSPAKAAMLEEMPPVAVTESSALSQWLLFSAVGAIVVIGIIAAAVIMGKDTSSDDNED